MLENEAVLPNPDAEEMVGEPHVCPVSHRRARRFFSSLVALLLICLVVLGVYCLWSMKQ